jgi:hypothetical protein
MKCKMWLNLSYIHYDVYFLEVYKKEDNCILFLPFSADESNFGFHKT